MSGCECTYSEMCHYCESNREADGFCNISSACSGPSLGGFGYQYDDVPEGYKLYTGGTYNECVFHVKDED